MSLLAYYQGNLAVARSLDEQALANRRDLDGPQDMIHSLKDLDIVARAQRALADAREFLEEAVALSRQVGDEGNLAVALDRLGTVAHAAGAWDEDDELYTLSHARWRRLGDDANSAWSLLNEGRLAMDRDELADARTLLRAGLALRRVDGHRPGLICLFEAFATLAWRDDQP